MHNSSKQSHIYFSTKGFQMPLSQNMLKVLEREMAKTNWGQTVDSALTGQKSFPSVYFHTPYMEVLDRELGLSVCLSQTYTTVCISQLTWGLMLQCFRVPELPLTKYRLKSVCVSSHVYVSAFFLQMSYVCLQTSHVTRCSALDTATYREVFLCPC